MKIQLRKLALSAMFLAMGIVLPFLTGQIKEIGDTLLPMHIPVMLCGLICGGKFGFKVGIVLPLLRSVTVGTPPIYPNAIWMALELATYGLVIGFLYSSFNKKKTWGLYTSLVTAMVSGRIVWGIAKAVLLGVAGKTFTINAFIAGGFIDSLPGIILQFILIPGIMKLIERYEERSCE